VLFDAFDLAALDGDADQRRGEALGYRLQRVQAPHAPAVEVLLHDHVAVLDDQQAVQIGEALSLAYQSDELVERRGVEPLCFGRRARPVVVGPDILGRRGRRGQAAKNNGEANRDADGKRAVNLRQSTARQDSGGRQERSVHGHVSIGGKAE
jgi:hypothetical protein